VPAVRSITVVNRSNCERFRLFIRRRVRGLRHSDLCLKSSMSWSWTAVTRRRTFRAFTSCGSNDRSLAIQLWSGSGGGLVPVVGRGSKFISQRRRQPKLWRLGSAVSSGVATGCEAHKATLVSWMPRVLEICHQEVAYVRLRIERLGVWREIETLGG
jgi:hypothetical protein